MIWAISLLAVGVVLLAFSILLRKKLGRAWMLSVLAGGVLLIACGGWFTYGQIDRQMQQREYVYLGLQYLEQFQIDASSFYLKKGNEESFAAVSANYLLEKTRGNDLTARLNLDRAATLAKTEEEQEFFGILRGVDVQNSEHLSVAIGRLCGMLELSGKQKTVLDNYVLAENSWYGLSDEELAAAHLDESAMARLQISTMIETGAYEEAASAATVLADRKPSAENRLLLAETVAQGVYHGNTFSQYTFAAQDTSSDGVDETVIKEREKIAGKLVEIEEKLVSLELSLNGVSETDEQMRALNEEKLALVEQAQELQQRADKLYVYRAFSSIADLHSLDAKLVRARLHFALKDYDKAVEVVLDAADSLGAKLTLDQKQVSSLRFIKDVYANGSDFHESQEFRDTVTYLLSSPFEDLIHINQSTLTEDFTQQIISDQKTYGQVMTVSHLDYSSYPTVKVTLSGREEQLRDVVEKKNVVSRDTHSDISYTAYVPEGITYDVCVVVDRSGSMDGAPMENLKAALNDYVQSADADMSTALIAFESEAQQLTGLTNDKALLLNNISSLFAGGGTNITAGIEAGTQTLRSADGSKVMLLMTDGQSSIDFNVVDQATAEGIVIYTIGFGDVNDDLLLQIAERTGGQYIKADSSSELSNVYASLQELIGNIAILEYTVTDQKETEQRYFFLSVEDYSVRYEYNISAHSETARLYSCSPSTVTPETLRLTGERGDKLNLTLLGDTLMQVQSVVIGGYTAEIIDQYSEQLRVSVEPVLSDGWQTVTLRLVDGTEVTFDRLLLVGTYENYRNIRLGSLIIPSAQGILPGDGTLVLAGTNILLREYLTDEVRSTLDLTVNGVLVLPWGDEQGTPARNELNIGDMGQLIGWGIVQLNTNDDAFVSGSPRGIVAGGFSIDYAPDQSKLISTGEE